MNLDSQSAALNQVADSLLKLGTKLSPPREKEAKSSAVAPAVSSHGRDSTTCAWQRVVRRREKEGKKFT